MRKTIAELLGRLERREKKASLGHLTSMVRRYTVEQQRVPKDLVDLVTLNYLASVPCAPPGRRFVIDRKRVEVRLE